MGTTLFPIEELGQRHSAVMWTGAYLKLNEYLSGQRGPLYFTILKISSYTKLFTPFGNYSPPKKFKKKLDRFFYCKK